MASEPIRILEHIRFGEDFVLEVGSYTLRRSGRVLKLERIPMEILLFLLEQRGQLVSRDQIDRWPTQARFWLEWGSSLPACPRLAPFLMSEQPPPLTPD